MVVKAADFYNSTRSARKIIVVDLGFLGDSVHLIPALVELKRHYPHAELHTLSAPLGRDVLQVAPCVDRAWAFPLGAQSPPWWRHWGIIRELRRAGFEVAFNFSGADRTIFLTALTGARWRVAHLGGRDHFWKTWLIENWVPRQRRDVSVFEQRRSVLAACGMVLEPARFELAVPAAARVGGGGGARAGDSFFTEREFAVEGMAAAAVGPAGAATRRAPSATDRAGHGRPVGARAGAAATIRRADAQ